LIAILISLLALSGGAPPTSATEPLEAAVDGSAAPPPSYPPDVTQAGDDWETCLHFSGEEPYDEARRRQINAAIEEHCGRLKREMPKLKARYAANPVIAARLAEIEREMKDVSF